MKKRTRFAALVFLAVAAVSAALYFGQKNGPGHKPVKVSGNIEVTDVRLAFRVQGKIRELLTDEGKPVKAGDVVARLETDELAKVRTEAEAALKDAEFTYQRAREDYIRLENVFQAGAVSAEKRDSARTGADRAGARVEALRAALDLASTRLGFADLISPLNGFILTKSAEVGEVVQPGAVIFSAADLRNIWLTAYVSETDLGRVKLNQAVDVKTDTYPDKIYPGRISFISPEAEFTPKQIQTAEERIKLVYRIKIMVDNANLELKPGMPADGLIKTE